MKSSMLFAAITTGLLASVCAPPAMALCTNGTTCPTGTSSFHELRIQTFLGAKLDMSGDNVVSLGTVKVGFSYVLAACVNSTLYFLTDVQANGVPTNLQQDSFLCLGAGNDSVFVSQGGNCGSTPFAPFAFGAYELSLYGQSGNDNMQAFSILNDVLMCGGDGNDHLLGGYGDDELDGWNGDDLLEGEAGTDSLFGYAGSDILFDWGYPSNQLSDTLYGEDGNDCLQHTGDPMAGHLMCGPGVDRSTNPGGVSIGCESFVATCF